LHEEVNSQTVNLCARVGKVTADELRRAMMKIISDFEAKKQGKTPELKHGKQTMRQLAAHNAGLNSIELTSPNLRLLKRIMEKNGVDFSTVRDGKGKYLLFFKGRDTDALTHAFNQYTKAVVKQSGKSTIQKRLSKAKERAKTINADKVKNRDKGAIER
jgi:hypothetical protein